MQQIYKKSQNNLKTIEKYIAKAKNTKQYKKFNTNTKKGLQKNWTTNLQKYIYI